jgi:hypothetical protein
MQLTEKIYSKIRKVKFIYGNKLHTHFVSHEETYSPDSGDGDLVEPHTVLVCYPRRGKHNKVGGLMDDKNFEPRLIVIKDSVLIVEKA